jgi:hypothetical protein
MNLPSENVKAFAPTVAFNDLPEVNIEAKSASNRKPDFFK